MDETTKPESTEPAACIAQRQKTKMLEEEFNHTRKRLARQQIVPLLQFNVFAYNCQNHDKPNLVHIDYSSQLTDASVILNSPEGGQYGTQQVINAVEHLLAALKERVK